MRFLLLLVLAALSASTPAPSGPYHIAGDVDMSQRAIGKNPLINGFWSCNIPAGAVYTRNQEVLGTATL
ncbi:hypothetical protein CGMCC3_g7319 [Colletotrichum fructicola]|nr:uncharacterized protein CGMCC3_g7319 [Colletotrichum fructicola]KAE9576339.1 hypothetical protein CGMCC3_g7319 [Colletotrichum fructicola]